MNVHNLIYYVASWGCTGHAIVGTVCVSDVCSVGSSALCVPLATLARECPPPTQELSARGTNTNWCWLASWSVFAGARMPCQSLQEKSSFRKHEIRKRVKERCVGVLSQTIPRYRSVVMNLYSSGLDPALPIFLTSKSLPRWCMFPGFSCYFYNRCAAHSFYQNTKWHRLVTRVSGRQV